MEKYITQELTAREIRCGAKPRKKLNPEWMEPLDSVAQKMVENGSVRGQLFVTAEHEGVSFNYNLESKEFVSGGKVQDNAIAAYRKEMGV